MTVSNLSSSQHFGFSTFQYFDISESCQHFSISQFWPLPESLYTRILPMARGGNTYISVSLGRANRKA
ncbi:hypothetical protein M199_gp057 [Halogranum tailed virus 1]|uniref:Uncharacterized protein n=1 Tax=Halogranum tailed virus 1 TaxID=1273749 RepID=R4T787_9CAUD|nr:hypothetical protein M199_gp057 [Halogranum tailed virus 1]AGM11609.1 hypothetical protein HGTV1_312 [Halogranum tailed virus 1]